MRSLRPVHWFLVVHVLLSVFVALAVNATGQFWPWAIQGLFLLLGAFLFVFREEQWTSVKALLKQTVSARHPLQYWLTALLLGVVGVASMAAYGAVAKPEGLEFVPSVSPMLIGLIFGVWLEENNWRGYALPRLVKLHGPVGASVILSTFWSVWHLPFFFTPDYASSPFSKPSDWLFHVPFYFAGTFLMTWVGIKTRYSVLLAVVAHTAGNMVSEWYEPEWMYFAEMVGGGVILLPVFWWLLSKEERGQTASHE